MSTLQILEIVVKSSLVAGLALLLVTQLKRLSAAQRASIAHFGLLATLLVPAQVLFGPNIELAGPWTPAATPSLTTAPVAHADSAASATSAAASSASWLSSVHAQEVLFFVYAAIAVLLLLTLVVGLTKLARLQHGASILTEVSWLSALAQAQHRMGFKQGAALLHSEGLASPVSWGVMRPTIMLSPAAMRSPDKAEAIIAHELAHVSRMDWLNLLIGRLATAMFWFNPLVWMLSWQAHELREEAADDVVLRGPVQSSDYASLLVEFARGQQPRALAAHAVSPGKEWLKRRLTHVLDHSARRDPAAPAWTAGCAAIALALAGSLGAFTPAATASADTAGGWKISFNAGDAALATPHELGAMSAAGVTPGWISEMEREAPSIRRASANDLTALTALDVTPVWIREMRQAGYNNLSLREITELAALGVDAQYVNELASAGYRQLSIRDLEEMAARDIGAPYITSLASRGQRNLSVRQLTRLRDEEPDGPASHAAHRATHRRHESERPPRLYDPPAWPLLDGVPRPPPTPTPN